MKQCWPAPERNKDPILEVLDRLMPEAASVLEIAGGSGQHAAHFAQARADWTWRPTDLDPANVASIAAWVQELALPNLVPPTVLDVAGRPWAVTGVDTVFCANMLHIAPWACAEHLVAGAGELLPAGGLMILYGPFRIGGHHTAPSNVSFDASLRQRDERWGVRDVEAIDALAEEAGFRFRERVQMPANNQTVIWTRGDRVGRPADPGP